MKAVVQRVSEASITIEGHTTGQIEMGLMVLLGIHVDDEENDLKWLAKKIIQLRVFDDDTGVMNQSIIDVAGDILLVSQFTLQATTRKGNRPSYIHAARPEKAIPLYQQMILELESLIGKKIQTGTFGADMKVRLVNDGPVTLILDSRNQQA